jgi:hypothetical protein
MKEISLIFEDRCHFIVLERRKQKVFSPGVFSFWGLQKESGTPRQVWDPHETLLVFHTKTKGHTEKEKFLIRALKDQAILIW